MGTPLIKILTTGCLLFGAPAYGAHDTTGNLVRDGGMEQWREVRPGTGEYNHLKEIEGSYTDRGDKLVPSAYQQGPVRVAKMETADVFSGKRALRLNATHFYMHGARHDAYKARPGDIYVVRYMVKGAGTVSMHFTVYGGLKWFPLERKGTPVPDKWTLIEQRILIGGTGPGTIYPRLDTFGNEILIDDVFVGRVLREDEQTKAKKVPKEYDQRVVFAPVATQAPAIDGRLDEECWKAAVPFSGFRLSREQALLAPQQASFRALYDEKAIYLGIEIRLPGAQRIREDLTADASRQDKTADVYTDQHSVEIFIQPPGRARYVQCVASLGGFRYDGVAMDKSWDGQWTSGISVAKDRWFLEVMIPAADLSLPKITSTDGWRLNVVDNKEGNYSTWAAVGKNYHNPFAFGALVTKEFARWRAEKLQARATAREKLTAQPDRSGLMFGERLARAHAFTQTLPKTPDGEAFGWETITRVYALMNFVDAVYHAMDAEIRYARFFAGD